MCVAYPMKVTALADDRATVSMGTTETEVSMDLVEDIKLGDYVIVHAGFAIQKLSIEEAQETIRLLDELVAHERGESPGS